MKIRTPALKTPAPKKEIRTPLTDWHQPIYSEAALKIMEEISGQHFARESRPVTAVTPVNAAETETV